MNKQLNKRFPCEECREQKRKCDCKQPCDRCERFNLKCVYLKGFSPRDQEFIQIAKEKEMHCEIEALTTEIELLQKEMASLQSATTFQRQPTPPLSHEDNDSHSHSNKWTPRSRTPSAAYPATPESMETTDDSSSIMTALSRSTKRQRVIAQDGSTSVVLSQQHNHQQRRPWILTIRNGKMEIETCVNTYNDLLPHLHAMTGAIYSQEHVPFTFHAYSTYGALIKAFNTMILNKYGKTTCRSWVNAMRMITLSSSSPSPTSDNTTTPCPQSIARFIHPLLDAYWKCKHYQHLAVHISTFIRLFVHPYQNDSNSITSSPAVMALCAGICLSSCQHTSSIIPTGSHLEYARCYYDQARQLIADRFDDPCLETFATFVFLALYEMTIGHDSTSAHYTNLALRMANMLRPEYTTQITMMKDDVQESILFHRLQTFLQQIRLFELATDFDNNDRDQRETGYARFYAACHNPTDEWWVAADDDSIQAHDLIEMHRCLQKLRRDIYNNSRIAMTTVPRDLAELTEMVVQQQINHVMVHWYTHMLPDRLKLSLPVLDAMNIPDDVYMKTVEKETKDKGIGAVLTVLALYDEGLLIAQSFLHKRLQGSTTRWAHLQQFWQGGRLIMGPEERRQAAGTKWARRIDKLLSVKPVIGYSGTDDEFFAMVMGAMFPEEESKTSVITLAIQTAINAVRLLRFLDASSEWRCFFDMRVLMDVWVLLTRVVRFERYLDAEDQTMLPRVRSDLEHCLAMVRNNASRSLHAANLIGKMEEEYRELLL
ncbi:hypothetical protein RO3G_14763 [Lichtheimia corymbifera JMRC:FSU:9682]|uniref:Zn(2)-C6 fungal-type domain-containing protein n=1 Tax=Lichtheimia corymbifera JMRC:FSU:9682 TaxID=1263082 RepID=A0A068RT16_9FUNG|nr:hypothetical protein RO3G_14763 [Lichtheimia corymbifera JMRC:FSU:9682]